ncbi:MAG TPA: hypothetical protein VKE51_33885 [Vicinamibacterales bacterium]|nr:hypothetical protein [Vicinamibacterales bacterium]
MATPSGYDPFARAPLGWLKGLHALTGRVPEKEIALSTIVGNLTGRFIKKHQWLFLHSLDGVSTIRRLVAFYVQEYNHVLPHSAFRGQTPDEMYFGTGDAVPADLMSRATAARRTRAEANRSAACERCPSVDAAA